MDTILELIITALGIAIPSLTGWLMWWIKQSKKHQKAKWESEEKYLEAIKDNNALKQQCNDMIAVIESIQQTVPAEMLEILKKMNGLRTESENKSKTKLLH